MYYKSYRIIDGKPTWVISDEDNNIIKDPMKEQIKSAIIYHNLDIDKLFDKLKNLVNISIGRG